MTELLSAAAGVLMLSLLLGLLRILRGPTDADRMLAMQLIGTTGVGLLLLLGLLYAQAALFDVALLLALLAEYRRLLLSQQPQLMAIGACGMTLVLGYLSKNMTDDFFSRDLLMLFFAINGVLLAVGNKLRSDPAQPG